MKKGYEFELGNGTILQFQPKEGASSCSLSHGDVKIEIDAESGNFRVEAPPGKVIAAIPAVVRFERKEFDVTNVQAADANADSVHMMRTCMTCGNQWCCATNGCINCGCGWVCD